jgi:lipopolysaccharide transport system permease protein
VRLGHLAALSSILALSVELFGATLRAQQRRTLLGYLWLLLPAAAAAVAASYVRSRGLLAVATPGMPYAVFVFAGTTLWQVFIEALTAPLAQLSANRTLITRLRFPHEGLILAGLWFVLLNAAIRMAAVLGLCALSGVDLAATAWLMPLGVAGLALLGLALGLLVAPVGLLYDDVGRGVTMTTALLFFAMPIAYPLAPIGWQAFNPVLPLIDLTRSWLVGPSPGGGLAPVLGAALVLVLAWMLYRLAQPHVVERLG